MIMLLLLLLLVSCSDEIVINDSIELVDNLVVDINRLNNELYIQVEIDESVDAATINSVTVNLEYIGGSGIDYSNDFSLYDNGENGDIIANNGIYTLINSADVILVPDEQSEIKSINFPSYFELSTSEFSLIPIVITITGKKYLATVNVVVNNNSFVSEQIINIDNTKLEIENTRNNLYIDDPDTEICDRIAGKGIYQENIFYSISFDRLDAISTGLNNNFIYETAFSVDSMDDCGSTGLSTFRFILNDLDTNESISQERSIIIFGCGDEICEDTYEDYLSCPEDCANE